MTILEFLRKNKSNTASKWRKEAECRRENKSTIPISEHIAMAMLEKMEDLNLIQEDAAEQIGITKEHLR
ncbi:hypothetical protein EZS27_020517, partial [termite gut metagenome]